LFNHLLVPLDGSSLAEAILPAALSLGRHFGARVTLLHVVEPSAPATIHGDRHLGAAEEAEAYLKRTARQFEDAGVPVDWHVDLVEHGDVAKSIFAHSGELHADLVTLTSHGASGLRGIVFGNIAQQVVQSGKVPVFMVRSESAQPDFDPRKILVPLDSSALYEPALELAANLAGRYGAALHILVVVPTMTTLSPERAATGVLLPSSTKAILDLAQDGAAEYVQRKVQEYKARGMSITAEVERGDTAPKILEVAGRIPVDLLVMATHGRAGLDAFWQGSVTPKVLGRSKAPVLMLRVEGPEPPR
jgi:nucleotide-binding universal stress UspA family protein